MLFDYCNDREKVRTTVLASYVHRLTVLSINKNLQVAGGLHDDTRALIAHTHSAVHATAMADKVARALNLLGADRDLDSADTDALLELIDEYLEDSEGIAPPVTQPFSYTASIMNNES